MGGKYFNEVVGNCKYSHISVFSFHAIKAITTGEGGMATTNNKNIYEKLKLSRSHGINKEGGKLSKKINIFDYQQEEVGYNFRLTEFQSALGNSQLRKLKHFISLRNKIAKNYLKKLSKLPIEFQEYNKKNIIHAYHIFVIRLKNFRLRDNFFNHMLKNGIKCSFHYPPIYNQPYYKNKYGLKKFIEMDKYSKDAITLPIYPNLKLREQNKIIQCIIKFFREK